MVPEFWSYLTCVTESQFFNTIASTTQHGRYCMLYGMYQLT